MNSVIISIPRKKNTFQMVLILMSYSQIQSFGRYKHQWKSSFKLFSVSVMFYLVCPSYQERNNQILFCSVSPKEKVIVGGLAVIYFAILCVSNKKVACYYCHQKTRLQLGKNLLLINPPKDFKDNLQTDKVTISGFCKVFRRLKSNIFEWY